MTITLYSKPACPFCVQAKHLLHTNKLEFEEIELNFGQTTTGTLMEVVDFKAANPTVATMPFIVVDGKPIGGFMDLKKQLRHIMHDSD